MIPLSLKIEDMGIGGEGIGKYEGMTFLSKMPSLETRFLRA